MDKTLYQMINNLVGKFPWLDKLMIFSARFLPVAFALALIMLYLTWQPIQQRGAFLAGVSTLIALGFAQIISLLYPRPRPYLTQVAHLLIAPSHDPSFPSDHTVFSFAIAAMVWRFNKGAGGILVGLAALVGFSRVYVGIHYPMDIVGGAVLGILVSGMIDTLAKQHIINNLLNSFFRVLHEWRLGAKPT
jgi:undecaprenyl-diphosphatase